VTTTRVPIAVGDCEEEAQLRWVEGEEFPCGLMVHRARWDTDGWVVSHHSGYAIVRDIPSYDAAIKVMRRIEHLTDWTRTRDELRTEANLKDRIAAS